MSLSQIIYILNHKLPSYVNKVKGYGEIWVVMPAMFDFKMVAFGVSEKNGTNSGFVPQATQTEKKPSFKNVPEFWERKKFPT